MEYKVIVIKVSPHSRGVKVGEVYDFIVYHGCDPTKSVWIECDKGDGYSPRHDDLIRLNKGEWENVEEFFDKDKHYKWILNKECVVFPDCPLARAIYSIEPEGSTNG